MAATIVLPLALAGLWCAVKYTVAWRRKRDERRKREEQERQERQRGGVFGFLGPVLFGAAAAGASALLAYGMQQEQDRQGWGRRQVQSGSGGDQGRRDIQSTVPFDADAITRSWRAKWGSRAGADEAALTESLKEALSEHDCTVIAEDWNVQGNLSNKGKGDLVTRAPAGEHVVIEVKWLNLLAEGHTAREGRRQKRLKVEDQARKYAKHWRDKNPGVRVIVATFTNERGLVVLDEL